MVIYVQAGDTIEYTPAVALPAGAVVVIGDLVGVTTRAIAGNTVGAIVVTGIFEFPKEHNLAIAAGALCYWDPSAGGATTESGGGVNKYIGKCVRAAAASDPTVRIRMDQ